MICQVAGFSSVGAQRPPNTDSTSLVGKARKTPLMTLFGYLARGSHNCSLATEMSLQGRPHHLRILCTALHPHLAWLFAEVLEANLLVSFPRLWKSLVGPSS